MRSEECGAEARMQVLDCRLPSRAVPVVSISFSACPVNVTFSSTRPLILLSSALLASSNSSCSTVAERAAVLLLVAPVVLVVL
jgi:hypothetical protein